MREQHQATFVSREQAEQWGERVSRDDYRFIEAQPSKDKPGRWVIVFDKKKST